MKRSFRVAPQAPSGILAMPVLLAVASVAGLVLSLTGEGWRDWLSTALLFLPVVLFVHHWRRRG